MGWGRGAFRAAVAFAGLWLAGNAQAAESLRILTWSDYVPSEVARQFTAETGIAVQVTLSNNEDMIARLRASGGAGFDVAQPSQDRIAGPQQEFGIYKPLDMTKIKTGQFIRSMLEATKKNTSLGGKVYGVPHTWGTDGLVVNTQMASNISDYGDLCAPGLEGKISIRAKRPTLIAFAFALGLDPFAAYRNLQDYAALMERVSAKLRVCRRNVKFFWDDKDEILRALRSGEIAAAMAWDTGGWTLNAENPAIRFIAPKSGALGWVDTFAIPAKGANDEAAYRWINFNMRPDIAAKVAASTGNFTASRGADTLMADSVKDRFADSFPRATIDNIKWYPAVPAGVEEIEARILDRLRNAP